MKNKQATTQAIEQVYNDPLAQDFIRSIVVVSLLLNLAVFVTWLVMMVA